jgi:dipeptidase
MGYFKGEDKDFSFCDAYAPINFGGARFCEARVWAVFNRCNSDMGKYLDYAKGENLTNRMPLYIKPDKKLSVHDVMELMRDYYQNTPLDMSQDVGAGPYKCIVRWRPMTWEIDGVGYVHERAISTQQTGFSFVSQSRSWLPDPVGGIFWFGVDDTYSTVYSPIYCGSKAVPSKFAEGYGSMMEFKADAAFWVFNQVSNLAYTRYNVMINDIQKVQKELETNFITYTSVIDKSAAELFKTDPAKATDFITEFSCTNANYTVEKWQELYHYLFVRYLDGNVKTAVAGQKNPKVEQPGYGEEWLRRIVKETGDRYKAHGSSH